MANKRHKPEEIVQKLRQVYNPATFAPNTLGSFVMRAPRDDDL